MQEDYWLQQAKALPFNGKAKIVCCGTDASMMINHTSKGYTGYCFRCSPTEGAKFHPHGELSIKQIMERKAATQELINNSVYLPKDFTLDIPDIGRVWLLKGGISQALATAYGIGYSPYYQRVIIPVLKDGELDAFIARSVTGERPKYIAKMRNPENALFISDSKMSHTTPEYQEARNAFDLVITEDVLSAIRVGRFTTSAALLGTSLSSSVLSQLEKSLRLRRTNALAWWEPQEDSVRVAVWLDPDKAGRRGASKIESRLSMVGWSVRRISSSADPKRLSDRDIAQILKEYSL